MSSCPPSGPAPAGVSAGVPAAVSGAWTRAALGPQPPLGPGAPLEGGGRWLSCACGSLAVHQEQRAGSGSVHRGHLALVQAELLGLEAEAGDAVGHVDPRGGGARASGAVGRHCAGGDEDTARIGGGCQPWPRPALLPPLLGALSVSGREGGNRVWDSRASESRGVLAAWEQHGFFLPFQTGLVVSPFLTSVCTCMHTHIPVHSQAHVSTHSHAHTRMWQRTHACAYMLTLVQHPRVHTREHRSHTCPPTTWCVPVPGGRWKEPGP